MAEPIAPIVIRFPTAVDPTRPRAALTIRERVPAWLAATDLHGALGAPCTLDFDHGMVVDMLAGEA